MGSTCEPRSLCFYKVNPFSSFRIDLRPLSENYFRREDLEGGRHRAATEGAVQTSHICRPFSRVDSTGGPTMPPHFFGFMVGKPMVLGSCVEKLMVFYGDLMWGSSCEPRSLCFYKVNPFPASDQTYDCFVKIESRGENGEPISNNCCFYSR